MNITRDINKNIFREYDIRGVYGTDINKDISYTLGKAFGTYIKRFNKDTCIVGHDNRLSSEEINESLITGILSAGINVMDIGLVTTPMLYYARIVKNITPAIMITASHNPKEDNGFKISFDKISNAKGEEIYKFRDFIYTSSFDEGNGKLYTYNIENDYIELYKKCLHFGDRKLKVVIDLGNGTTSVIAKKLYSIFNIDLITIFDESDGRFPNHHPDPIVEENLTFLKEKVKECNADVGIGFDGDGDRAGFVFNDGSIMTSDKYAVIVLRDLLKNSNNKKVLYDVKCSKMIKDEILKLNGVPIENRTGASYMMDRVITDNILFGIEYSGHIYFNTEFPPITSGLYAGLKLLEIMSKTNKNLKELLDGTTDYYSTPECKFEFSDDTKHEVIKKIEDYSISKNYEISLTDGVKVYFDDSWALVRASNTGPNITTRFEATTEKKLKEIENEFVGLIKGAYEKDK